MKKIDGDGKSERDARIGHLHHVRRLMWIPSRLVQLAIELYRRAISPMIPNRCRYYPSCSRYAVEAVRDYGVIRGAVISGWRLIRCNPLSNGGVDHVYDQKIFRSVDIRTGRQGAG